MLKHFKIKTRASSFKCSIFPGDHLHDHGDDNIYETSSYELRPMITFF